MKVAGSSPAPAIIFVAFIVISIVTMLFVGVQCGFLPGETSPQPLMPIIPAPHEKTQACICSSRHHCEACSVDKGCMCVPKDVDLIPEDSPVTIEGPCPCVGGFCDPYNCKMADGGCGCSFLDSYLAKKKAEAFAKKMIDDMGLDSRALGE